MIVEIKARAGPGKRSTQGSLLRWCLGSFIGGILGLAIGQWILWWPFRTDPFHLAPHLPAWASPLAPESLRGPFPKTVLPSDINSIDAAVASRPRAAHPEFAPAASGTTAPEPLAGNPSDGIGVRYAPQLIAADLKGPFEELCRHRAEWLATLPGRGANGGDSADERYYQSLRRMAHAITYCDPQEMAAQQFVAEELNSKLDELMEDTGFVSWITGRFERSWGQPEIFHRGIAFVGQAESIETAGAVYVTGVSIPDPGESKTDRPMVVVVCRKDPRQPGPSSYAKGEKLLILGDVIDRPVDELAGYEGPQVRIVWGGYFRRCPSVDRSRREREPR